MIGNEPEFDRSGLGVSPAQHEGVGQQLTAAELNALTSTIIAIAIDIHRALGPGMLERAYTSCLCHELQRHTIPFEREKPIAFVYNGFVLNCAYRADVIVAGAIVLEVKALENLAGVHGRQMVTYLKLADCRVGLILNFGAETMRAGIKRVVNRFPE